MNLSHLATHYGLLVLSIVGVIQCVRVLRIVQLDMKTLTTTGANGPKRIIVVGRLNQSAFLLGAFAVLLSIGARVALAEEHELNSALVLTLIVSCDVVALILCLKEMTIRRNRTRLDAYFDRLRQSEVQHAHRRSTDPAPPGENL